MYFVEKNRHVLEYNKIICFKALAHLR